MRIKKFESFDITKDDFDISSREVKTTLDKLIEEYDDFTNDISPKWWRLTGSHISDLKKIRKEIDLIDSPITVEEKEAVKKYRDDR